MLKSGDNLSYHVFYVLHYMVIICEGIYSTAVPIVFIYFDHGCARSMLQTTHFLTSNLFNTYASVEYCNTQSIILMAIVQYIFFNKMVPVHVALNEGNYTTLSTISRCCFKCYPCPSPPPLLLYYNMIWTASHVTLPLLRKVVSLQVIHLSLHPSLPSHVPSPLTAHYKLICHPSPSLLCQFSLTATLCVIPLPLYTMCQLMYSIGITCP